MIEQLYMVSFALMQFMIPAAMACIVGLVVYTFVLTYHRTRSILKAFVALLP